jgi:transcriptional regulator with XRE-family HTH domain
MKTLRELREAKDWSQAKLAAQLDISPSTVFNWESGRSEPRFSQARAVAALLGVSLDDLEFVEIAENDKPAVTRTGGAVPQPCS